MHGSDTERENPKFSAQDEFFYTVCGHFSHSAAFLGRLNAGMTAVTTDLSVVKQFCLEVVSKFEKNYQ